MQRLLTVVLFVIAPFCRTPAIDGADRLVCASIWSQKDAVMLFYDPANGSLSLRVEGGELTSLEITSKSGVFTGTRPGQVNGIFDIFTPFKLFMLKPGNSRFGSQDFGTAMKRGFPHNFMLSDLLIDGSYANGGSLRTGGGGGPYGADERCLFSGDFNEDQQLDHGDLDALAVGIHDHNPSFDLTGDKDADLDDWIHWVHEWKYSWIGDADLNGRFDNSDLLGVFSAGKYEQRLHATWLTGDWSGDFEFNSGDLVLAFQDGGYERGTRDVFPARPDERTWFGDANLDGEFNTDDFIAVFWAGKYEDGAALNSDWASGDWNGDGEFDTADFVLAFKDAGFETGPRAVATVVPEPRGLIVLVIGLCWFVCRRTTTSSSALSGPG